MPYSSLQAVGADDWAARSARDPARGRESLAAGPTKPESCHGLAVVATRLLLLISRQPMQKWRADGSGGDGAAIGLGAHPREGSASGSAAGSPLPTPTWHV